MTDYPTYAPIVKKAFGDQERAMTAKQEQMEKQYVELIKSDKKAATALLQKTNLELLAEWRSPG